jgi:hypothetical protein
MAKREAFFRCVFASDRNEYQFHFRAWDEEDAEAHFREALRGNGVRSTGELVIADSTGKVVRRSTYDPAARPAASPRPEPGRKPGPSGS